VSLRNVGIAGFEMFGERGEVINPLEGGAGSDNVEVRPAEGINTQPFGPRPTERTRGFSDGVIEIEPVNEKDCAIHERERKTPRIATRRGPASPQARLGMMGAKLRQT